MEDSLNFFDLARMQVNAVIRRLLEDFFAWGNELETMQGEAVKIQERNGAWRKEFYEELTPNEREKIKTNPNLPRAEALFWKILGRIEDNYDPSQIAITTLHLATLLHFQGREEEATELFEDVLKICRQAPEESEPLLWAQWRAAYRLGELAIRKDPVQGRQFFAESMEIAHQINNKNAIILNEHAKAYFGL